MDTLTHGVIGALAARSCTKANVKKSYILLITAFFAAAFPDIDYLLFWLHPYKFITEWHRGLTHSLILLPLWAVLISSVLYRVLHKRLPFTALFAYCCLGLLTHIATDLITLYGVQLFAPLSNRRYALFIVFDIDPWIGLLAVFGMISGLFKRCFAIFGLLAILTYLLLLSSFQQNAQNILESRIARSSKQPEKSYAIPQPLFPFHWKLVIDRRDHYEIAHLSLYTKASKLINNQLQIAQSYVALSDSTLKENAIKKINNVTVSADRIRYNFRNTGIGDYRSASNLKWRKLPKFGDTGRVIKLTTQVWKHDALSEFRNFAAIPILYRINQDLDSECVWFTDLRYVFPIMMPPFRYGMCRYYQNNNWKLFRLRRHSENSRQLIKLSASDP
jgi:inner membrane protein